MMGELIANGRLLVSLFDPDWQLFQFSRDLSFFFFLFFFSLLVWGEGGRRRGSWGGRGVVCVFCSLFVFCLRVFFVTVVVLFCFLSQNVFLLA